MRLSINTPVLLILYYMLTVLHVILFYDEILTLHATLMVVADTVLALTFIGAASGAEFTGRTNNKVTNQAKATILGNPLYNE